MSSASSILPNSSCSSSHSKYWQEKEKAGDFVPSRREDVPTVANKKRDHSGRTKGVRNRVDLQNHFGKPNNGGSRGQFFTEEALKLRMYQIATRVRKETLAEMKFMKEQLEQLEQKISHILKLIGMKLPVNVEVSMTPTSPDHSSCDSSEPMRDPLDEEKGPLPCQLKLSELDFVVVANGVAWPTKAGALMDNVELMTHFVRVSIDQVIVPRARLPVPVGGFTIVGEVEGNVIQWPKQWVVINDEVLEKYQRNSVVLGIW